MLIGNISFCTYILKWNLKVNNNNKILATYELDNKKGKKNQQQEFLKPFEDVGQNVLPRCCSCILWLPWLQRARGCLLVTGPCSVTCVYTFPGPSCH